VLLRNSAALGAAIGATADFCGAIDGLSRARIAMAILDGFREPMLARFDNPAIARESNAGSFRRRQTANRRRLPS